jgi:hypothetical protein
MRLKPAGSSPEEKDPVDTTGRALTNDKDNTQNSFRRVPPVFQ